MATPENISHYRLGDQLGAGGMGVVFKAEDTKLDRWVAIKLLNAAALADPERLQRFVQEAKTTSALNHPSITTIHQLGEHEGHHYIVMEYVEGETVRERLRRGPLDLRPLLDLGVQVADGLAAAHAAGVVHRDLKPENLMFRADGNVKILDFGLAKLLQADRGPAALAGTGGANAETVIQPSGALGVMSGSSPTMPGLVMGTVGYMAPEQVRGEAVDARADIFALGAVLYETATAERAFGTGSPIEVMHAILKEWPRPLHVARPDAPVELTRILRKAMAKDPNERYQSAKELAIDLRALRREVESGTASAAYAAPSGVAPAVQWPSGATPAPSWPSGAHAPAVESVASGVHAGTPAASAPRRRAASSPLAVAAWALIVLAFGLVPWFMRHRKAAPAPAAGGTLHITRVTSTGKARWPALSPDGKFVAYAEANAGQTRVMLHQLATGSTVQLVPPMAEGVGGLVFSPDGNWLTYLVVVHSTRAVSVYRVATLGGTPQKLYDDLATPVSFSPDGKQFAFMRLIPPVKCEIYRAAADGSVPPQLLVGQGSAVLLFPQWSPDGQQIAMLSRETNDYIHARFILVPAAGGAPVTVPGTAWTSVNSFVWQPNRNGFYAAGKIETHATAEQVFAVPLDGTTPRQITSDLNDYTSVTTSADGKAITCLRSTTAANFWRLPARGTAAANTAAATQIDFGTARTDTPGLSPDGKSIVYVSDAGRGTHLWVMNVDGSNAHQITSGTGLDLYPEWSPDGRSIAYTAVVADSVRIWVANADGTNPHQMVRGMQCSLATWSPDSKWIAFNGSRDVSETRIWKIAAEGGTPVPMTDVVASFPRWSPDGSRVLCFGFDKPVGGKSIVMTVPVAGGAPTPLPVPLDANELMLAWTPDGKFVTSVVREGGASNLINYPVAGGTPQPVSQFPTGMRIYAFAPLHDGSGFIVSRGVTTEDVVLLQDY